MKKEKIKNFLLSMSIFLLPVFLMGRKYVPYILLSYGTFIHLLMYMLFFVVIMTITKKSKASFIILNVLEYLFFTISYLKLDLRSQILEPWDFIFLKDAGEFFSFLELTPINYVNMIIEFSIMIIVTIYQILIFDEYCEIPPAKKRIPMCIASILLLVFLTMNYLNIEMKYLYVDSNGTRNYSRYRPFVEYGGLGSFLLDIGAMQNQEAPEQYTMKKINELNEKYENYKLSENLEEYDNVIFVLLESYVDITKLEEFSFEEDPLYNYHKYAKENASGSLSVTNIGGGTANVEYEALTMFSTDQYLSGIYPYLHCINDDINVLPRVLKNNGYNTTAIHTHNRGFYNRYRAYPFMGIDEFIAEDDFENPELYGPYISDMEIYDTIVKTIEEEEKSFITATTMATHTPYNDFEFFEYDEYMEIEKLSEDEQIEFNNYLQEVRKLDEMIGKLIEYVNNSEEKTMLIMYGDHFPLIYSTFYEMGILENNEKNITPEKYPRLFNTPYIVVSNCQDIETKGEITPSRLGSYVLENVKLDNLPWYYNLIHDYHENDSNVEDKENYELIQYDEISGQKYWKSEI